MLTVTGGELVGWWTIKDDKCTTWGGDGRHWTYYFQDENRNNPVFKPKNDRTSRYSGPRTICIPPKKIHLTEDINYNKAFLEKKYGPPCKEGFYELDSSFTTVVHGGSNDQAMKLTLR